MVASTLTEELIFVRVSKGSTYILGDEPKDRMEFEGGDGADVSC